MKKRPKNRDEASNFSDIEKRITPVKDFKQHLTVCLYGRSSTGKTTLACDFPGPVLLIDCNDQGTDSVKDHKTLKVLRCEDWVDIEKIYWYIKKNPGKFKTIVLDTVSMMQELAINHYLDEAGSSSNGRMMTKQGWGQVGAMMKTWIMNFRDLPVNVVFIAQDRTTGGADDESTDEGQIMPEVGPRLMPSVASVLNAAVSIIGNTFIRERTIKIKTKEKKIEEKRKIEYCLRIGPHSYYTTKVRKPKAIVVPAFIVNPTYEELVATLEEN